MAATALRADEPLPAGRFSVRHYQAIHRHLFQDVYAWAGRFRTVRISRGGNMFCYPESIPGQMASLFADLRRARFLRDLSTKDLVREAASFLATLNAIHPFREGNGRTQLTFMALLCHRAGRELRFDRLDARRFLEAMVASFHGDEALLRHELRTMIAD